MRRLTIKLVVLCLFLMTPLVAVAEDKNADYFRRAERYRQQVAGEVQRRHEINLETAREEVLNRRIELGTPKTYVSVNASASSYSKNNITQENTNNA